MTGLENERERNEGSVLREWVSTLPWKMQSVLLSGLRGPDERRCPEVKKVIRFLRAATQNDAGVSVEDSYLDLGEDIIEKDLLREVEYLSVHFGSHLLYALEIVAYRCPWDWESVKAYALYSLIVDDWHLVNEGPAALERRLA